MTDAENLKRWQDSGEAHRWVWNCSGVWCDEEYADLLVLLRMGVYWPMNENDIMKTVEAAAETYHNLNRWNLLGDQGQGRASNEPAPPEDGGIWF